MRFQPLPQKVKYFNIYIWPQIRWTNFFSSLRMLQIDLAIKMNVYTTGTKLQDFIISFWFAAYAPKVMLFLCFWIN